MSTTAVPQPMGHPQRWRILGVLCTSLAIVIIGNSSLNVALPKIAGDLGATNSELQWIVDAYSLVFAGLLFAAGTLGDRFGRKGALQLGLGIFLAAALFASLSDSVGALIAARAIMGLGAAFVMPATLSIIVNVFPLHERAKAIALWTAIAGAGGSVGPIGSGLLLEHYSWSSVFLVNVPVIAIAMILGVRLVPTSRDPEQPRVDVVGALLSIAGIVGIVYAVIEAPKYGWLSVETIGVAVASLVVLVLFVLWELRTCTPMLDMRYFRHPGFTGGSVGMAIVFMAMFGLLFLITQYFQFVVGYSPLETALRMLPFVFVMMLVSPQSPRLVARFGSDRIVGVGLGVVAAGVFLMTGLRVDSPYPYIASSMGLMAAGMALSMPPLTNAIMAGVPRTKAGVGSAMNDTSREIGGALGVAVLGSITTSQYGHDLGRAVAALPGEVASMVKESLGGALFVAQGMGPDGAGLASAAREAFTDGMAVSLWVCGAVIVVAGILAYRLLPRDLADADHGGGFGEEPEPEPEAAAV